ncbi:hypothetical protein E2C01_072416 [Portunus trituberculatus]|uniref:Uncharacterized protein n=1 Tax=Portunus trituberculatus TaxID=210409 RepID=A0A5B7I8W8_PORTR|nr:hypothetical protein [Portunus trituberculatus]
MIPETIPASPHATLQSSRNDHRMLRIPCHSDFPSSPVTGATKGPTWYFFRVIRYGLGGHRDDLPLAVHLIDLEI